MLTKIRKRDGREVDFDSKKITECIYKARCAVGSNDYENAEQLSQMVTSRLEKEFADRIPGVEEIQDIVENVLMVCGHALTAKEYILYRAERTRVREMNTRLMKIYGDITFTDASDSDIKRENANIDGNTAMGAMLKYGSEGAKEFYGKFVLKPEHTKAHRDGDIHIHDLDFYTLTTTCCQIDIRKLFKGGFSTGHGHLREPNDIQSYAALACIAIQSNQNDQHGGQSIVNFDYGMSDGVRKTYKRLYLNNLQKSYELLSGEAVDIRLLKTVRNRVQSESGAYPGLGVDGEYITREAELLLDEGFNEDALTRAQVFAMRKTDEEIDRSTYQAMEAFIHNLNTMHSRAGAQTPFSSINYGLDTSPEGRLVIKNILLATEAGLGHGETAIFPIQIFRIKKGVNYEPDDPNYDLLKLSFRVSAKRMYPNYAFQDAPFNAKFYVEGQPETEIAYMGCRTRVIANVFDRSSEISHGRGNLSFTTINLPRAAIKANHNIEVFFEDLERKMSLVLDQLLERFEIQAGKRVENFPFLMGQGVWIGSERLHRGSDLREVLKHGTLSIGFIGLAECLKSLTGHHHGENAESRNLGVEIISFMRRFTDRASERLGLNVTLLATPAEGLSGRFVEIDRNKFGVIEGVTDKEYYTNSFHVPVYFDITAFDKIKIEAPYHELTNAGHITYVELDGDVSQNLEAFERVIRAMYDAGIGYGSVNHPIDRDPVCGFTGVIGDECPLCGRREDEDVPVDETGEYMVAEPVSAHAYAVVGASGNTYYAAAGGMGTGFGAGTDGGYDGDGLVFDEDGVYAGVGSGLYVYEGENQDDCGYAAYAPYARRVLREYRADDPDHQPVNYISVPFERIRRITGYLVGTLDRFNNAKRAEERDRVKHG